LNKRSFQVKYISNSPDETFYIGKNIANFLKAGSVVALQGTLGSGKTYLTKGIASGLEITDNITSPTYTIINEYPVKIASCPGLYHIDLYRLKSEKDFIDIGGIEIINSGGICIIEWSEYIQKLLPDNKISISIHITGSLSRLIEISGLEKS